MPWFRTFFTASVTKPSKPWALIKERSRAPGGISSASKAQTVFAMSNKVNSLSWVPAHAALACISGTFRQPSRAYDHAKLESSTAVQSPMLRRDCEAIAAIRGMCLNSMAAKAQAVFAKLCGSNCRLMAIAADAIAFISGAIVISKVAQAQAVFDKFWPVKSLRMAIDAAEITSIKGSFLHSNRANAQAVLERPWASACGRI
mmetsp:Transcript_63875/g.208271  ORF Transcript_63875/g.208271 Transcript_63875/m.208271 type:complete len:202 (-) Transcript_63875:1667-2272(-)